MTVTINGNQITVDKSLTLSEILHGEKPCGGRGSCGKCKVIAKGALSPLSDAERRLLTEEEIRRGARLACMTRVEGDCEVSSSEQGGTAHVLTEGAFLLPSLDPLFTRYGASIDVGTTTLALRLYGTDGALLAKTALLNPQAEWGADVVSRIEAALDGKASALAASIRAALDRALLSLAEQAGVSAKEIDGAVITGNTVMLSLLTEESVEPLSHAPFQISRSFGETLDAKALDLSCLFPKTPVYLAPCISAFVGADVSCAILATDLCREECAMLADIGTNGEMALCADGRLTVCSTAAGPAFEGVGISMGMQGIDGAIDKVSLSNGTVTAHVLGDLPPRGICGSGLVDAVACMLESGVIDEGGCLEENFTLLSPVTLTPKDLRMLQLAKSAIAAGLLTLTDEAKITPEQVKTLFIAGGFGSYLNTENAARIGLLPRALAGHAKTVGNAALSGASMILLSRQQKAECERIAKTAVTVELNSNPVFSEYYVTGMLFDEI